MSEQIHAIPAFSKRGEDAQARASIPTFAKDPDGTVRGGCSFIVRASNGKRWLILPAHIAIAGPNSDKMCRREFSLWVDKIYLRPTLTSQIDIAIFADTGRKNPKFKIVGNDAVSDVIALSLPDSAFDEGGQLHGVGVIDIRQPYNNTVHSEIIAYGFPPQDGVGWPYMPPRKTSGEMLADLWCSFDCPNHDTPGFSGAPVFASGRLAGMFVGSNEKSALLIPAWYIFMLINFDQHEWLPIISVNEWNAKGAAMMANHSVRFLGDAMTMRSAIIPVLTSDHIGTHTITSDKLSVGVIDADTLIADNVIVQGHLVTDAASKRSIIQMSGSNIPTSQTLLATLSLTGCTTTDPVDFKISGTYKHSGGATGFKIFLKPTHTWLIDTADVDESGTADGTSQPYCKVLDFTNDVNNKGLWSLAFTDIPTTSSPSWAIYGQGVGGSVSYTGLASVVQSYR